jgi:hypothetical protein
MKKLILAAFALTTAASVFAQGTITFNNRLTSTTHVWGPSSSNPSLSLIGLGSNDAPTPGNTPFAADGMTMIGANGLAGQYGATLTLAQLIGANGAGAPASSLLPMGAVTTFRTGGAAGNIAGVSTTLIGIPADSAAASFEMVVWDDSSGNYSSWTLASVAWQQGQIAAGESAEFTVANIGGTSNVAPNTIIPSSFNLYFVPEPTSFALAGLGAAAMMIFRRRK